MVSVGAEAPDFILPALDGLEYGLHEARGKGPVLLMFWHADCRAAREIVPYVNRLYDGYENIGWSFWTIAQDGASEAGAFAREHGLRPTVLVDGPALRVSDLYDPEAVPALYLIEPGDGVTLDSYGVVKDDLNQISRRIAGFAGAAYVEVAPGDDGRPSYMPGCGPLHV